MICHICNKPTNPTTSSLPKFVTCTLCGGNFLKKKVKANYPEEYFDQKGTSSLISTLASPILQFLLKNKIRNILSLTNSKNPKILDYGCGAGKLVENLQSYQTTTVGYEPSKGALNITKRKNLPVFGTLKDFKGGYDLIMFWHSLEHVDNPYTIIATTKKLLNEKGKILLAVPNGDSFEALLTKDKWFHYSYPLHTIHFTPKAVKMMLQKAGFKEIKIDYFNPEYTVSGLIQTFLNIILPKDVLYSVVTHRRLTMSVFQAIIFSLISIFLTIIFSPILILFYLTQLIFKRTGAMVITAKTA